MKFTFGKFLIIGIINTIIGYGSIFFFMFIKFSPETSNLFGYIIGINVSYILNKKFTFKSKKSLIIEFPKFLIAVGIAYILNFLGLIVFYRILKINPYTSQVFSGIIYTISSFFLFNFFVFR